MERQTDGKTDRWKDRQMERQTDGKTDRWKNRQTERQTDRDRQIERQTDRKTDRWKDRWTGRKTDSRTDRLTYREKGHMERLIGERKETDRWTLRQAHALFSYYFVY
jgi:hypothetical protein